MGTGDLENEWTSIFAEVDQNEGEDGKVMWDDHRWASVMTSHWKENPNDAVVPRISMHI